MKGKPVEVTVMTRPRGKVELGGRGELGGKGELGGEGSWRGGVVGGEG